MDADHVAMRRLEARKRLRLESRAKKDQDKQLAEAAWELATKDGGFSRITVFCDRREKKDDGGGPSAQGVAEAIENLAKGDKKAGRPKTEIHPSSCLSAHGACMSARPLRDACARLGFIGEKKPLEKPAFLVATSAGEVGVDIDADHMVCDLVAWERMVQRLGRVNRRGEGDAEITVFWSQPSVKDAKALTELEKRAATAFASKTVIENRPQIDSTFDASPGALRDLAESARSDAAAKALIDNATTPEPLRPALNRALVDAWSMTSLETHTGRPDVAPWLRGWVEETPQTTIIWRSHLPIREGIAEWPRSSAERKEIEDFFEAAPPHQSEKLETETYRVASWLQAHGNAVLKRKQPSTEQSAEDEETGREASAADEIDAEAPIEQAASAPTELRRDDIVVMILSPGGEYAGRYTLRDLAQERKGDAKKDFENKFSGKTLVIDARFGGLKDGLLDSRQRQST